mgnify:CR=1 FL=1
MLATVSTALVAVDAPLLKAENEITAGAAAHPKDVKKGITSLAVS